MHSTIILFCADKNEKNTIGHEHLDDVIRCNDCADYIGDTYTANEIIETQRPLLPSIFPDFIKYDDGEIKVDDFSDFRYGEWFIHHLAKVREWQDKKIRNHQAHPGLYEYFASMFKNVITDTGDTFDCNLIYAVKFKEDYGDYISFFTFIDFVEHLALCEQGQTLHIIGGADYHF